MLGLWHVLHGLGLVHLGPCEYGLGAFLTELSEAGLGTLRLWLDSLGLHVVDVGFRASGQLSILAKLLLHGALLIHLWRGNDRDPTFGPGPRILRLLLVLALLLAPGLPVVPLWPHAFGVALVRTGSFLGWTFAVLAQLLVFGALHLGIRTGEVGLHLIAIGPRRCGVLLIHSKLSSY